MRYFPAAARIAFESPPCLLPAAGGCGVVRRRRAAAEEPVALPVANEALPNTFRLRSGPHLRART